MMRFATVLVPNLPIALAYRDEPALVERPLLLYTTHGTRATVSAASDAAADLVGLSLRQALVRWPDAVVRRANPTRDAQAVARLRTLLARFSPRLAPQHHGADALVTAELECSSLPSALAQAGQLVAAGRAALQLEVALGLAATATVAQLAAHIARAGAAIVVPPGQEAAFLAPQPIALLPVEPATLERLRRFGLRTIGQVARLPRDALAAQLGGAGGVLYDLAHGRDIAPLRVMPPAAQVTVRRRFAGAVVDARAVDAALGQLAAELAARLDAGGWAARTLTLTVTLADDPQVSQETLATPTTDMRRLGAALRARLHALTLSSGLEALAVAATDLAPVVAQQAELFAPAAGRCAELDTALAQLAARFPGQVLRATLADADAACPERRVRLDDWTAA